LRLPLVAPLELPGPALPIDAVLPTILAHLSSGPSLVIEAPPGAGKTTRVPLTLLLAGLADDAEILVLQPRRLAARLAAQRVADLLGEEPGQRIGYQVRFESRRSARTRLTFMTEGLLSRRLRDDPQLRGVAAVILDEFHERHLDGDLALALLRQLQRGPRPELRLVVMSATLDGQPIADFLGAPRVVSEGRAFPVEISHVSGDGEIASQVLRAFHDRVLAGLDGDLLVFLPGAREIQATHAACAGLAAHAGVLVLPLHGDLPPAEQDRAVRPAARPKLILSTNVAETSVTIDGVTTVIDSGLARVAAHDPWSGIATLQISRISRASAAQRAGRAGRTRPGRCLRLYSQHDLDRRPEFTPPEIARLDLSSVLLDLHAAGHPDPHSFPWFEAPPPAALAAAEQLLTRLGALDDAGRLTPVGQQMLRFPTHPRLARLLLEGERRQIPELCASAAALLSERSLRRRSHGPARVTADADLLVDLADLDALVRQGLGAAERLGLSPGAARQALQARDQLCRLVRADPRAPQRDHAAEISLRQALLLAFPDRVAQVREEGGQRALALAGGGAARLAEASSVLGAPWVLALALEERQGGRGLGGPQVTSAAAIEPEWLFSEDLWRGALEERDLLSFDPGRERVTRRSELRYLGLLLEATDAPPSPAEADDRVFQILREAALAAGPARFADPEALAQLHARTAFIARLRPDFPLLDDARARAALAELCAGCTSFAELRQRDLLGYLTARAQPPDLLHRWAPTRLRLPGGRELTIHYELDRPPWLATRLQDFFGAAQGPSLADGRVPVVLHLLAPNGRDLQVTTDLAGFWDRHYPDLRRALMRRYPRHAWPEDPRSAAPPAPPTRRPDRR
jgi:ATP-dependent helicase HrpB